MDGRTMDKRTAFVLVALATAAVSGCAVETELFAAASELDAPEASVADDVAGDVGTVVDAAEQDALDDADLAPADSLHCEVVTKAVGCADTTAPHQLLALDPIVGGEYDMAGAAIAVWSMGDSVSYHASEAIEVVIVEGHDASVVCTATGELVYGVEGLTVPNHDMAHSAGPAAGIVFCGSGD